MGKKGGASSSSGGKGGGKNEGKGGGDKGGKSDDMKVCHDVAWLASDLLSDAMR
jgi:hypothetical protein